jgi:hypothetical protein
MRIMFSRTVQRIVRYLLIIVPYCKLMYSSKQQCILREIPICTLELHCKLNMFSDGFVDWILESVFIYNLHLFPLTLLQSWREWNFYISVRFRRGKQTSCISRMICTPKLYTYVCDPHLSNYDLFTEKFKLIPWSTWIWKPKILQVCAIRESDKKLLPLGVAFSLSLSLSLSLVWNPNCEWSLLWCVK